MSGSRGLKVKGKYVAPAGATLGAPAMRAGHRDSATLRLVEEPALEPASTPKRPGLY